MLAEKWRDFREVEKLQCLALVELRRRSYGPTPTTISVRDTSPFGPDILTGVWDNLEKGLNSRERVAGKPAAPISG